MLRDLEGSVGVEFEFVRLDPSVHDRASFDCGNQSLNQYFATQANQDTKRWTAACFVAVSASGSVAGYYTLSSYSVPLKDIPPDLSRKLSRHPNVPAVLLGRLAVAQAHQGKGLGGALLADAFSRASKSEITGFAIVVDAIDARAEAFYEKYGFLPFPSAPGRLFIPMETARQAVQESMDPEAK